MTIHRGGVSSTISPEYLKTNPLTEHDYIIYTSTDENRQKYIESLAGYEQVINVMIDYHDIARYNMREANVQKCLEGGYIQVLNSKFALPLCENDLIQKGICADNNYFEYSILEYYTRYFRDGAVGAAIRSGTVLDVGANIGNHTLYYANECGAKRIISFEPCKDTFAMLQENIRINGLENVVTLLNKGAGEHSSKAQIKKREENNIGGTSLELSDDGELEIVSIDEMGIDDKVTFMKIDVEGLESSVLKGAMNLIRRDRPYIALEAWDDSILDILDIMIPEGYYFEQVSICDYLFFDARNNA